MSMASIWCLHCWLWTYFTPSCRVSIVNFEQVIDGWVLILFCFHSNVLNTFPTQRILLKVRNRNTKTIRESWSKFITKSLSNETKNLVFTKSWRGFWENLKGYYYTIRKNIIEKLSTVIYRVSDYSKNLERNSLLK